MPSHSPPVPPPPVQSHPPPYLHRILQQRRPRHPPKSSDPCPGCRCAQHACHGGFICRIRHHNENVTGMWHTACRPSSTNDYPCWGAHCGHNMPNQRFRADPNDTSVLQDKQASLRLLLKEPLPPLGQTLCRSLPLQRLALPLLVPQHLHVQSDRALHTDQQLQRHIKPSAGQKAAREAKTVTRLQVPRYELE